MRKPTDICLLCKINPSTKTNSHILPKFLSKKLFGPKTAKRGFQLSSAHSIDKRPKIIQDSPKEDYILCAECEMYFSVLESICADTFINWRTKVASGDFTRKTFSDFFSIVLYSSSDKAAVRLFIYSVFWRTSISSDPLFQNISISNDLEEALRSSLMAYRTTTQGDFLTLLKDPSVIKLFPIAIITADSFTSETSNVLFVPPFNEVYRLVIDQFSFLLFKSKNEIPVDFFKGASNFEINDCRVIIFSYKLWADTIIKPVFDLMAETMLKNGHKK